MQAGVLTAMRIFRFSTLPPSPLGVGVKAIVCWSGTASAWSAGGAVATGHWRKKVLPSSSPGEAAVSEQPSCSLTMPAAMYRPSPLPPLHEKRTTVIGQA